MIFQNYRYSLFAFVLVLLLLFSCNAPEVVPEVPFEPIAPKFTIATSAGVGGSITDSQSIDAGQSVTIIATAQKNYQFKEWTGDCGSFSPDNSEITISASKNCQIRAEFEKIIYTIRANSKGGGSISESELLREQGQIASFTAEPDEGYQLSEWTLAEGSECPDLIFVKNKVSFTVEGNCSLEAVFTKAPRTITIEEHQNGEISINPSETVEHGDEVKITAIADEHYAFKGWSGSCGEYGTDESTITIILVVDCTISAVFEKISYTITATSSDGGSVSDEELSIVYGEAAALTAIPEEGYQFSRWMSEDCPTLAGSLDVEAEFSVEGNCSLVAVFTKALMTITIEENENGQIIITPPSPTVEHGEKVQISATANDHFVFKSWEGTCGEFNSRSRTISFDVTKNCEIKAVFEEVQYTITAKPSEGGNVSDTVLNKTYGQEVELTAEPDQGYSFTQWATTGDDCPTLLDSTSPNVAFIVEGDCQLDASFKRIVFTITASSSEGGKVSQRELGKEYGQEVSLTAKPDDGYVFDRWELAENIDCPTISDATNPELKFNVKGDCNLRAVFIKAPLRILTTSSDGGKITDALTVNEGEKVTITATADSHNELKNWEGNCGKFDADQTTISFTVTKDCEIKAVFTKILYTMTIEAEAGGSVNKEQDEVPYGEYFEVEAKPDNDYIFERWTKSGDGCPDNLDFTYSIATFKVEGDCHLKADFKFIGEPEETSEDDQTSRVEPTTNQPTTNQPTTNQPTTNQPINTQPTNTIVNLNSVKYNVDISTSLGGKVNNSFGFSFKLSHNHKTHLVATPHSNRYSFSKWKTDCGNYSDEELSKKLLTIRGIKDCEAHAIFIPLNINTVLSESVITTYGTNYNNDPIYSQIDFENAESYLIAFIRDARRHGYEGDLNIKTDGYKFGDNTGRKSAASAFLCTVDPPIVRLSSTFWSDLKNWLIKYYQSAPYIRPDIDVIWHEFGHAILGLEHVPSDSHIMYRSRTDSSNNAIFWYYNSLDSNRNWFRAVSDLFSGKGQINRKCGFETYTYDLDPSSLLQEIQCFHN